MPRLPSFSRSSSELRQRGRRSPDDPDGVPAPCGGAQGGHARAGVQRTGVAPGEPQVTTAESVVPRNTATAAGGGGLSVPFPWDTEHTVPSSCASGHCTGLALGLPPNLLRPSPYTRAFCVLRGHLLGHRAFRAKTRRAGHLRTRGDEAGVVGGAGCAEDGREGWGSGVTCGSHPTQSHDLATAHLGTLGGGSKTLTTGLQAA